MKKMILATGLQSGGTTLVSGAFLQHSELDGILDMASDRIEMNLNRVSTPITWVKMTTISFRWKEVASIYEMAGYKVYPLLVVRNPFDVWVSLKHKWYGLNSTTAEDPPLTIRFQRFIEDWHFFKKNRFPILQFEDFLSNTESVLKTACVNLPIEYESRMTQKLHSLSDISYVSESNQSFFENLSSGISTNVARRKGELSDCEFAWVAKNCEELIAEYSYVNEHQQVNENCYSLVPNPYDSRRFLGFGPQAHAKRVSSLLPALLKFCHKMVSSNRRITIYGASEFGEFLLDFLCGNGIDVSGFYDSFAASDVSFCDRPVSKFRNTDNDEAVIIASFKHCKDIEKYLLNNGLRESLLFGFGPE